MRRTPSVFLSIAGAQPHTRGSSAIVALHVGEAPGASERVHAEFAECRIDAGGRRGYVEGTTARLHRRFDRRGTVRLQIDTGGVFPQTHNSRQLIGVAGDSIKPRLWTPHPSDPTALVLTPAFGTPSAEALRGLRALKVARHAAHHRFGTLGRLQHVQLNTWRVGVKGSGSAVRLPLVPLLVRALMLLSQVR